MVAMVVRGEVQLAGVDNARVWALVADPLRLEEWASAHTVGYMGTELPSVGNAFYVNWRSGADPQSAVRFEITRWAPGTGYRCSMSRSVFADERKVEVRIDPHAGGPNSTHLKILHSAEVSWWAYVIYRTLARRRIDASLSGLTRKFATP